MTDKNKIIERIVKLFRLGHASSNTTEAEMMLAATKARQLMVEHSIAMADIEGITDKVTAERVVHNIKMHTAYTRKISDLADYDQFVAQAVDRLFDVRHLYWSGRNNHGVSVMRFVGTEIDAEIAAEVFHIILTHVRKMARRTYGSDKWTKEHTSYAVGFANRLIVKAEELKKAEQSNTLALVLYSKSQAVSRWLDQNIVWEKAETRRAKHYDNEALSRGYIDGNAYNIENFKSSVRGQKESV